LNKLVNPTENKIFGSIDKAIPVEKIQDLNHSLTLIKANSWQCIQNHYRGKSQIRIRFSYNDNDYDFPVTDLAFCEDIKSCTRLLHSIENLYLTISLGLEFKQNHYKLIAGVIWCE